MKQTSKKDFKDWMRPNLRAYYKEKINFLHNVIDEIIPDNITTEILQIALGENYHDLNLERINEDVYHPMKQYLKVKGKLFRPLICCLIIEGYGKNPDNYKPILAISEIIHSCSLMLDDIADASLLRRGKPCAHQIYGISRTANASSAMTFLTFRLLQSKRLILDTTQKLRIYDALLWEHYITSVGSALDLGWTKERRNEIPDDEYIQHILFRSCSYTYRHAARIGAIVAGADKSDLKAIFQFSSLIGVAFQFIDDILNVKPGLDSWGKTVAEDITEGKRSLLVLHTLNKATDVDRLNLLSILDGKIKDPVILQEAVGIMKKYGAFEVLQKRAENFINQACHWIQKTKISNEYKSLLEDYAYYVIERKI